jgi:hypothetical protein
VFSHSIAQQLDKEEQEMPQDKESEEKQLDKELLKSKSSKPMETYDREWEEKQRGPSSRHLMSPPSPQPNLI